MTERKDEIINSLPRGPNTSPSLPAPDLLEELAFDFFQPLSSCGHVFTPSSIDLASNL